MAEFPYTPQPPRLKPFLTKIQGVGVPDKVTQQYLETVGFKTKNDRYFISILKSIGFLDSAGTPTDAWKAYRSRASGSKVLAQSIRRAYSDLFKTYPDAHRKDNEALRDYFSAHTKVAERTLGLIVQTFRVLCELADFEAAEGEEEPAISEETSPEEEVPEAATVAAVIQKRPRVPATTFPTININIQLQLPATEDSEIYDKLFASLKKHLFSE